MGAETAELSRFDKPDEKKNIFRLIHSIIYQKAGVDCKECKAICVEICNQKKNEFHR